MKQSIQLARCAVLVTASVGSWASVGTRASAQELRPQAAPVVPLARRGEVLGEALSDPSLRREVALEAMRKPLAEALAELAALGGVALTIDAAQAARLPQDCRVTMRVRALPLARVLASLAELYGGQWQKGDGASWIWLPLETPLALQARRLGGMRPYFTTTEFQASNERRADLAERVLTAVDAERLGSPEGIALSETPADLRALLIQETQEQAAVEMAQGYTFFQRIVEAGPFVRLGRLSRETPRLQTATFGNFLPGDFGVYLMVEGNRAVASLFDAPTSSAPGAIAPRDVEADKQREEARQAADAKAQRLRDRIRNPNAP